MSFCEWKKLDYRDRKIRKVFKLLKKRLEKCLSWMDYRKI